MKAKKEAWGAATRIKLADVLPIETPISVGLEVSSFCNLSCNYCVHGAQEKSFPQQFMSWEHFTKAIDSLKLFDNKLKNIVFSLNGEPLMNKQLPEMISYIKKSNVSEKITVFTNAILLSEKLGQAMLDAGLDILRVSIQGVTSEKYMELCNREIDYNMIVEHVRNFYEYRNRSESTCHIFVKIIDQSFSTSEDEYKFYADFGDICDQISVETIVPIRYEINYDHMHINKQYNLVKQMVEKSDVCAQPFYSLYVRSDGNVTPCCIANSNNLSIGNIENESLLEIWNGSKLKDFRKMQLTRNRYQHAVCQQCKYPESGMQVNDKLDHIAEILYKRLYLNE